MFNAPFIGRGLSPIIFGNSGQGAVTPDPLQPFYDSGTIGIHYATDAVTTDGGGLVTGLRNKGAAGAVFDASVSGKPIAISGNAMNLTITSGTITTATAAALSGVRLMFVVGVAQLAHNMRFFGHSAGSTTWDIYTNLTVDGLIVRGDYIVGGVNNRLSGGTRIALPASGYVLIEVEFSPTQWLTWINGAAATVANSAVPSFVISNLGQGVTTAGRFLGPMGDVVGVLTGMPDTNDAIAAVKTSLNAKFGTPT